MPHTDTDEVSHVPTHYRIFPCALAFTTATLAIQLMHSFGGPDAEQTVITLRVACTVVWAWFFTVYAIHVIGRRMDGVAERLAALEGRVEELVTERPPPRERGLDTDAIESARVIAMNLMRHK